jgi:hypothetical protein
MRLFQFNFSISSMMENERGEEAKARAAAAVRRMKTTE